MLCSFSVFCVFLVTVFDTAFTQFDSPCPNIFDYALDERENLFGRIKITNPVGNTIVLNVELSVGNSVHNYNGHIELSYGRTKAVEDISAGRPLHYKINFPVWRNFPPRVTKIIINGNLICSGPSLDIKRVPVLTTINLQHTLKISGVSLASDGSFEPSTFNSFDITDDQSKKQQNTKKNEDSGNFFLQFGAQPNKNVNQQYPENPFFQIPSSSSNGNFQGNQFFTLPTVDNSNSWNYFIRTTTERITENPPIPTRRTTTSTMAPFPQEIPDELPDIDVRNSIHEICGKSLSTNQLIANGSPVIHGYYPWLAALYTTKNLNLEFTCGGTLISSKHVITAAHCLRPFDRKINIERLLIILGKYNIQRWTNSKDGITLGAKDVTIHSEYRALSADADIAIITLTETVRFKKFIRPICLWSGDSNLKKIVDQSGVVAGWGKDENGNTYSAEPKQVSLPIVSQEECLRSHDDFTDVTSSRTFCAGYRNGSGPCNGDSGGGFMMLANGRWTIRGIVSMSIADQARNCDLSQYLVFTDVSKFLDWILAIIN